MCICLSFQWWAIWALHLWLHLALIGGRLIMKWIPHTRDQELLSINPHERKELIFDSCLPCSISVSSSRNPSEWQDPASEGCLLWSVSSSTDPSEWQELVFYELLCSIRIFYNVFLTTSKMVSTCPKAPMQIWANCHSIIFYVYGCTEISDICCANSSFHWDPNHMESISFSAFL